MNKFVVLALIVCFLFSCDNNILAQAIENSVADFGCGSSSGTLTVTNYSSVLQWEIGDLEFGKFFVEQVITTSSRHYNYSTTYTRSYRAKLPHGSYSEIKTITILAPSIGGTTSGSNSFYQMGSGNVQLSGHSGNIIKWQKSINGGSSWTDIAFTGTTYSYSNLTQTTLFRAIVQKGSCPSAYSSTSTITVLNTGILTGPSIIADEGLAALTLENHDGNIVRWECSTDGGSSWIHVANTTAAYSHRILLNTKFRVLVDLGSLGTYYSNTVDVAWIPYSQANPSNVGGKNYVRVHTLKVPDITDTAAVENLTASQKHEVIAYQDGKGQTIQQVLRQATPQQKDMVSFAVNESSNVVTQYLPYASSVDDGSYRSNALAEQASFYTNGAADKVTDSAYPYSKTIVERSPLSRVVEQGSVGEAWQPGGGHTMLTTYGVNVENEVRLFNPDGSSTGFYPANELIKVEVTDEDQRKQQVFTDKSGHTILSRVELNETIEGATVTWLETYSIHDVSGKLKYMISPKGVAALQASSWAFTPDFKRQYVFEFVYDELGRLIEKKVPGQDWLYYCYDRLDRVVLVQDGNIRDQHKWFFIKYDRMGRMVMQGLYTDTTDTTRAALQSNVIDPLYALDSDKFYEERGTASHGYTNQTFPTTNAEILTVNYYSSYDFDFNGLADCAYVPQALPGEDTAETAEGLPTGAKRLVLGTATWLYQYIFYDIEARPIQVQYNNHLSATLDNVSTTVYDFEGKVTTTKTYHNAGAGRVTTVVNKYTYDHQGRIVNISQRNNDEAEQVVVKYEYNELGQVVDKKLHNVSGTNYLQSIDYRYSIQGWLESINNAHLTSDGVKNDESTDYFGMEFLYNNTEPGLTAASDALYSGNISAIKWKGVGSSSGTADQRGYKFTYDKANRLKSAVSKMNTGADWTKENGVMDESMMYDHNGNILTLQRAHRKHELSGIVPSYGPEIIDDLTYTYNPSLGDQLVKVTDAALAAGFTNGDSGTNNDFTYNASGSLLTDNNKGISGIVYNILGKPQQITFVDGRKLEYVYDASGTKLTMKTFAAGSETPQHTTDYVNGFVYENDALSFFASPEGRVVKKGNTLEYQYAIADHQGNTRVVFSSANPSSPPLTATFEDAYADAADFQNVNTSTMYWVPKSGANNTPSGQYVIRMNNTYTIGPAKSLDVFPGDVVDLEVWAYYEGTSGFGDTNQPLNTLIGAVTAALTSGLPPGESTLISNGVNSAYGAFGAPGNVGDDRPTAYLNYILLDQDYKVLDMGWQPVPASANMTRQKISFIPKTIKEAGHMYVYLSYEGDGTNWVYFDDLKITHTPTNVIQYNEYYPFGLQTSNSWTREDHSNDYLYNAASELNRTSDWYETFFRGYDPALGRFLQVDPLAISYAYMSPYHYAGNNPVVFNDPLGDQIVYMAASGSARDLPSLADYRTSPDDGGGGGGGGSGPYMGGSAFSIYKWESYFAQDAYERDLLMARNYNQEALNRLGAITITDPTAIRGLFKYDGIQQYKGKSGYWTDNNYIENGEIVVNTKFVPFKNAQQEDFSQAAFDFATNALRQMGLRDGQERFLEDVRDGRIKASAKGYSYNAVTREISGPRLAVNANTNTIVKGRTGLWANIFIGAGNDPYSKSSFRILYDPTYAGNVATFHATTIKGMGEDFKGGPAILFMAGSATRLTFVFETTAQRNAFIDTYYSVYRPIGYMNMLNR